MLIMTNTVNSKSNLRTLCAFMPSSASAWAITSVGKTRSIISIRNSWQKLLSASISRILYPVEATSEHFC
jgi:hypothetical protein